MQALQNRKVREKFELREDGLTELSVSFDAGYVASALYWFPKNGELRLFICANEATKDGLPERV